MNNPLNYQLYQARRAEELRNAEQRQLARQAQSNREAFYRPALAQLGRRLMALGQRLQDEARPAPRSAYR